MERADWVGLIILTTMIACIFYVAFGQLTVRKLRKNQATKGALGTEFASGWDIINVAQALALPKSISRKLNSGPLGFLEADPDLLEQHTSRFDRVLARVFYWTFMVAGIGGILLVVLNALGLFD